MNCINCSKTLVGKQTMYCSQYCKKVVWDDKHREQKRAKDRRLWKENKTIRHRGRIRALHRQHNKKLECCDCGSIENLENDHRKYVKGKEGLKFVEVRCKPCHLNRHKIEALA